MKQRLIWITGELILILLVLICATEGSYAATSQPLKSTGYSAFQSGAQGGYSTWDSSKGALSCDTDYAFRVVAGSDSSSKAEKGTQIKKAIQYKNGNGKKDTMGNPSSTYIFKLKKNTKNKGAVKIRYKNYYWYSPKHEKAIESGEMAGYVKLDIVAQVVSADYVKRITPLSHELAPYITISKKAYAGMTRLNTLNVGILEMKYSYYYAGTSDPVEIASNFTYLDIDWGQGMSFKASEVKKSAVTKDTKLSYKKTNGWHFFSNYAYNVASNAKNPENGVSIAYKTSNLSLRYHSDQVVTNSSGIKVYKENACNGARSYYEPSQYWSLIKFDPPPPQKTVSYEKQEKVTEADIPGIHEVFTFQCTQEIPEGYTKGFYFDSFSMKDKLDTCLSVDKEDISITNRSGKDISSLFEITLEDSVVTAKCLDTTNEELYGSGGGETITMNIPASLRHDITEEELQEHEHFNGKKTTITIENDASSTIDEEEAFSNKVSVYFHLPTDDEGDPGIAIEKIAEPYEFQVGEKIPYKISIHQTNPKAKATCVKVTDQDFPEGIRMDQDSLQYSGIERESSLKAVTGGFEFTTKELKYGETVTISFDAVAQSTLNGKVIPNKATVTGDLVPKKSSSTTVYINSPKISVKKTITNEERASEKGDSVEYSVHVTNINPGTFMRNVYLVDTVETEGLTLNADSLKITDEAGVELVQDQDYKLYSYESDATEVNGYSLETSDETRDNTGEVLPKANHGGFLVQFLGKYANLRNADADIPALEDPRGSKANYMKRDGKSDYEDLNLAKGFKLTYSMNQSPKLSNGETVHLKNFVRVPATENTNGTVIQDQDEIPSGGDFSQAVLKLKGEETVEEPGEPKTTTEKTTPPDEPSSETKTTVSKDSGNPDTGDHVMMIGYLILVVLSIGILTCVMALRRQSTL